jgi:hypothetical protein
MAEVPLRIEDTATLSEGLNLTTVGGITATAGMAVWRTKSRTEEAESEAPVAAFVTVTVNCKEESFSTASVGTVKIDFAAILAFATFRGQGPP